MAGEKRSFWVYFKGDLGDLQNKTRAAKQELRQAKKDIDVSMRAIGVGMTGVGGAIVGALGYSVKEAMEFEEVMRAIATLGVDDLDAMRDGIREMAATYGLDLVPAARSAYDTVSGLTKNSTEALLFMNSAAKAAVAGQTDLQTSAKLGVSIINAFGQSGGDAARVYDELFIAVREGVTTFPELAASVGQIGSIFAQAGLSTAEMASAVSALTLSGKDTARSVTSLQGAMNNIIKPSQQAADMAAALELQFDAIALKEKGIVGFMESVTDAMQKQGPEMVALREKLGDQIEMFDKSGEQSREFREQVKKLKEEYKSLEGVSESQIMMMSRLFGSVEGLGGMLALAGEQAGDFARITKAAEEETGVLDQAFKEFTTENVAYNMRVLGAQFKQIRLLLADGLLPMMDDLSQWLIEIVKNVGAWIKENHGFVKGLTIAVGAAGALMSFLGPLLVVLPGLTIAIKALMAVGIVGFLGSILWYGGALVAAYAGFKVGGWLAQGIEWFIKNVPILGGVVGWWIDYQVGQLYWMWGKLKQFYAWITGTSEDRMRALSPEERDRAWRESQHGPMLPGDSGASGGARPGGVADGFFGMASRVASQGSGIARQAMAVSPALSMAGGSIGGGINLNISFGDVRIREQADINRIADAITRRAYDMLAQRGIRR